MILTWLISHIYFVSWAIVHESHPQSRLLLFLHPSSSLLQTPVDTQHLCVHFTLGGVSDRCSSYRFKPDEMHRDRRPRTAFAAVSFAPTLCAQVQVLNQLRQRSTKTKLHEYEWTLRGQQWTSALARTDDVSQSVDFCLPSVKRYNLHGEVAKHHERNLTMRAVGIRDDDRFLSSGKDELICVFRALSCRFLFFFFHNSLLSFASYLSLPILCSYCFSTVTSCDMDTGTFSNVEFNNPLKETGSAPSNAFYLVTHSSGSRYADNTFLPKW